ncbi:MAG: hypothetical protein QM478_11975 [Flavobacteriaceae bacterium]
MSEEQIQTYIIFLQNQLNEYYQPIHNFKHGKNIAIREAGERKSDNIRNIVENYLVRNDDLHQIFMRFFADFSYEEALSWQYFDRDFPRFVEHLEGIMKSKL